MITAKRKRFFCYQYAQKLSSPVGFIDVGSGGPLKDPWNLLPLPMMKKFDFEPVGTNEPLCVSDHQGNADFYVAEDERSSSLHQPLQGYIDRFGDASVATRKTARVRLDTLDNLFSGHKDIDCIDVNTEGHDLFVLKGATRLFQENFIKLVKVEFELTQVWSGQGWFGDIDALMRDKGYDLADIEVDYKRPRKAAHIFHKGEPLWGKAYYVPSMSYWGKLNLTGIGKDHFLKGIMLYVVFDMPARAIDLVDRYGSLLEDQGLNRQDIVQRIASVYRFAQVEHYGGKLWNALQRLLRSGT